MSSLRRSLAPLVLAPALLLPSSAMAAEELPAMLQNMPGMQLIAAVDAMHAGDLTKAEALFSLAIQQGRLAPEGMVHAYFNRGLVRQRMGNLRAAIADFSTALASDALSTSGRVEAYYNRGLAWRRLGELQKAMDDFSRAIELQPRFAPAYYSRALGLTANGHYLLALVDLDKALRHGFAARHKVHYSKAMIHLARGERDLAVAELRKALKSAPGFRPAKVRLAMLKGEARSGRLAQRRGLLPAAAEGGRLHARLAGMAQQPQPAGSEVRHEERQATPRRRGASGKRVAMKMRATPRPRPSAVRASGKARHKPMPASSATATGMMIPAAFAAPPGSIAQLATASIAPLPRHKAADSRKASGKSQDRLPPQAAAAQRGGWAVQLGASRRRQDMAQRWQALRGTVSQVVARPQARIARARVKGRGVFHRLRLEGFATHAAAAESCRRLKARGISCLVVKLR